MINKKNLDKKKLEEENNLLKIEEAETKEKDKDKSEGLDDFIKRIRPKKVINISISTSIKLLNHYAIKLFIIIFR